jgi:mono/diheme cytochrome c family protein
MTTTRLKRFAVAAVAAPLFLTLALISVPARADTDDAAATYKTKCFACHGAKAEKKWDSTHPEDQMVDSILKGKKVEKPPNMPGFAEKGIDADQAKALIAYMKSLKQ